MRERSYIMIVEKLRSHCEKVIGSSLGWLEILGYETLS